MRISDASCFWACIIVALVTTACASTTEEKAVVPEEQPAAAREPTHTAFEEGMLPIKRHPEKEYYPPHLKRLGIVGRVSLAYSVNAKGRPENISMRFSDHDDLEKAAKSMLQDIRFKVPSDWVDSGGSSRRYRLGFIFQFAGKPKPPPFEDESPSIEITTEPLSR